jgi:uncharacterized protein YjbI with pentapeptide repeats
LPSKGTYIFWLSALSIIILTLSSCVEERVLGPDTEVITRKAGSETYFLIDTAGGHNPQENTIRIGGVVAFDLEARGEVLADSVIDSFNGEPGIDIVRISVENEYTYHFSLEDGLNVDMELIDPFDATVFRLTADNPSESLILQPGNYGLKIYNNNDYADSLNNRKLLFLRPDTELVNTDPLGILSEIPQGNLETDHYMILAKGNCRGCDLTEGFFEYFTFHHGEGERVQLTDIQAEKANFRYAKMRDVDISGSFLTEASFEFADLSRAAFFDISEMSHTNFNRTNLNTTTFTNVTGRYTTFEFSDMRRMKILNSELTNSNWIDCIALGSEIRDTDLSKINMTFFKGGGSIFANNDFTSSELNSADMVGCDVTGSIFNNADLTEANFSNANVAGATFCNIFQYRNLRIKLASGIANADCLLELIERIDAQQESDE